MDSNKQRLSFQDRLNVDIIRYILSFLNISDYENSKLYLRSEYRLPVMEKKIALLKHIYRLIPQVQSSLTRDGRKFIQKFTRRECKSQCGLHRLKNKEEIDCFINEKLIVQFWKKRKQLRRMGYKIVLHKRSYEPTKYHFLLWRKQKMICYFKQPKYILLEDD